MKAVVREVRGQKISRALRLISRVEIALNVRREQGYILGDTADDNPVQIRKGMLRACFVVNFVAFLPFNH
jgi:hypothetical protein